MIPVQYLITAGCSFSAGTSDLQQACSSPQVWPHFLSQKIDPKFLINLAIPGGGNQQIADNLIYLLETKKYITAENSLIGINFTGLDRIDTMCAVDHPDANKHFGWSRDFGFGWITEGSFVNKSAPFNGALQKNMELTQVQRSNLLNIVKLLSYLNINGFKYFFMMMNDEIIEQPIVRSNVCTNQERWVHFGNFDNMKSFVTNQGLLAEDRFHPSKSGHEQIAKTIFEFLIDKKLISMYNS